MEQSTALRHLHSSGTQNTKLRANRYKWGFTLQTLVAPISGSDPPALQISLSFFSSKRSRQPLLNQQLIDKA